MSPNRYQVAIERLSTLLDQLIIQSKDIDQLNTKHKSHWLIENNNLFSQHLFSTESDLFTPYANEIKKRLNEFSRLYNSSNDNLSSDNTNKIAFAKSSLQQVEQQISALMNAMQGNKSMHQAAQVSFDAKKKVRTKQAKTTESNQNNNYNKIAKAVLLSSHQLYQKLSETHEFERRLMAMISEREQERLQSRGSINNNKLSQEVLALHQRLGRCRKAISAIERNIQTAEKSNLR
jgi:primosomal replication protein N''